MPSYTVTCETEGCEQPYVGKTNSTTKADKLVRDHRNNYGEDHNVDYPAYGDPGSFLNGIRAWFLSPERLWNSSEPKQ